MNAIGDGRGFNAAVEAQGARIAAQLEDRPIARRELTEENVDRVGREFEALFLGQLVKEMRKTLPEGLFGTGPGADTYEGWFDQHIGDTLAAARVLDLGRVLRAGLPGPGTVRADSAGVADTEVTR